MFGVCVKLGTFGFAAFLGYVPLGVAESARTVPAAPCVSAEACLTFPRLCGHGVK
jgi:hypothetical protein